MPRREGIPKVVSLEDFLSVPWKSKTKQRMVFRMIQMKDSLLPMGKVWFLDVLGVEGKILKSWFAFFPGDLCFLI